METLRIGTLVSFDEAIWTILGIDLTISGAGRSGNLFARTDVCDALEPPIPLRGDAWYVIDERPFGPITEMLVRTFKKAVRTAGAELNAHIADRGASEAIEAQRAAEVLQQKNQEFVHRMQAHIELCEACRKGLEGGGGD